MNVTSDFVLLSIGICISNLCVTVSMIPDRNNVRGEGFILPHSFENFNSGIVV